MNIQDAHTAVCINACSSPQACLFMRGTFLWKKKTTNKHETRVCFGKLCIRQMNSLWTGDSTRDSPCSSDGRVQPHSLYKNLLTYKPKRKDYFTVYHPHHTHTPFVHLWSAWIGSAQNNIVFYKRYKAILKMVSITGWNVNQKVDLHYQCYQFQEATQTFRSRSD